MYTIAISNEKGGVAKTTSTISLGACLAELGCTVLVVDLDPQANLTLAFGFEPNENTPSIDSAFLKETSLDDILLPTEIHRLFIIHSHERLGLAERTLPSRQNHHYILKSGIQAMKQSFDFILLDCPPALGVITRNAMIAANLMLIPTQAEYFSVYALRNLMAWVRQVRVTGNPALTYRLLLTLYDRRNRSHRVLSEQLRQSFNSGLLKTVIEIDTKLREAPIAGTPIIYYAPKSRASLQYRTLAQEIFAYAKETSLQQA
jgi:chromosome partitioning protein